MSPFLPEPSGGSSRRRALLGGASGTVAPSQAWTALHGLQTWGPTVLGRRPGCQGTVRAPRPTCWFSGPPGVTRSHCGSRCARGALTQPGPRLRGWRAAGTGDILLQSAAPSRRPGSAAPASAAPAAPRVHRCPRVSTGAHTRHAVRGSPQGPSHLLGR